jgi:structure-specific recognition protein 1
MACVPEKKCSAMFMLTNYCFSTLRISSRFITLAHVQNPGQFEASSGGLTWNRQGGGETIRIDKADITSVKWTKVPRANELEVSTNDGLFYKFIGFPEQVIISYHPFLFIL